MSLSFRKKKDKKVQMATTITGPVNLKEIRSRYATSSKELKPEEVSAYKARMIEKYEQQQAEMRDKPLTKPQPNPKKMVINTTDYEKFQGNIVGDFTNLRRITMYAIQTGEIAKLEEEKQKEEEEKLKSEEKQEQKNETTKTEEPPKEPKEEKKIEEKPVPQQSNEDVEIVTLPEMFPEVHKKLGEGEKKNIEQVEKKINEVNEKWHIKYDELEFDELVASGASGEVHLGYLAGLAVAIKKIAVTSKKERQLVDREYSLLRRVNHPNIIKFLGVCDHSSGFFLITEYIAHGDLFDLLNFGDRENLTWRARMFISLQIASACEYLHSIDIIHRDLKSQNVLIGDTNFLVKLCDFGFATALQARTKKYLTTCGTEEWLAPEIALEDAYDHKVDIFSFGVVLTELIMCRPPRKRKIKENLAFNVTEFESNLPEDCPQDYAQLVVESTRYSPDDRPEFKDIVLLLEKLIAATTE